MIVTLRNKQKHKQTISQIGLVRYNKLSLNLKLISNKSSFKIEIEKYVLQTKTTYLRQYDDIELQPHQERQPSARDVTYILDDQRRIVRNTITHSTYKCNDDSIVGNVISRFSGLPPETVQVVFGNVGVL